MLSYETAAVCQQTRAAQHFGTVDNSAGSLFTLLKQTLLCIPMEPTDRKKPADPTLESFKQVRAWIWWCSKYTEHHHMCRHTGLNPNVFLSFMISLFGVKGQLRSNRSEIYRLIQHKPSSCHSTSNSPHGSTTAGTSRTGSATVGFPSPTHNQVLWCDKSGHPVLG